MNLTGLAFVFVRRHDCVVEWKRADGHNAFSLLPNCTTGVTIGYSSFGCCGTKTCALATAVKVFIAR